MRAIAMFGMCLMLASATLTTGVGCTAKVTPEPVPVVVEESPAPIVKEQTTVIEKQAPPIVKEETTTIIEK